MSSRFELRPPYICFHDTLPGQHATLFSGAGRKLLFSGEASHFNDHTSQYTWAFLSEDVAPGERLIFATADREVVGAIGAGGQRVALGKHVLREASGKPIGVLGVDAQSPQQIDISIGRSETPKEPTPVIARFG